MGHRCDPIESHVLIVILSQVVVFTQLAYAFIHLNFMVRFRGFSVPGPTRLFLRIYYKKELRNTPFRFFKLFKLTLVVSYWPKLIEFF